MDTRWKAISAVMLVIFSICIIFFVFFSQYQDQALQSVISTKQESAQILAQNILSQLKAHYTSRMQQVLHGKADDTKMPLLKAFAQRNRPELLRLSQALFASLQNENANFASLSWYLPDDTVFLRVHNPEKFGDSISRDRPDIAETNHSRTSNDGFACCTLGMQYRVVAPVFLDNRYLGVLQFGLSPDAITDQLEEKLRTTTGIAILKSDYAPVLQKSDAVVQDEQFVLISKNIDVFQRSDKPLDFSRSSQDMISGEREYKLITALDLEDFSTRTVGKILVALDISKEFSYNRSVLKSAVILSILLFVLSFFILFLSFNTLLRRITRLGNSLRKNNRELEQRVKDRTQELQSEMEEREKAQAKLIEKSIYLNSILQSSTKTGIVAADMDLCIRYFNPEAERIFDLQADQVLGQNIEQFHGVKHQNLVKRYHEGTTHARESGVYHFSFQRYIQGRFCVFSCNISMIRNEEDQPAGYLLIIHDISDQIKDEQEKEEIHNKLRSAQKMEAIGLMAGGVAHDLNNILSGIVGYPDLLLKTLAPNDPIRESIQAIRDSGRRAAAVVSDLLTIARGAVKTKEIIDLNNLVQEYINSPECQQIRIRHPNVRIETRLMMSALYISCSSVHIKKCLMNLVNNAAEAIGEDGLVTICTNACAIDSQSLPDSSIAPGEYVLLTVTDTGSGIHEDDIAHIFEPFYTKKRMGRSGTGLGLSVVWNTMQDHQGTVQVNTSPSGTVFSLYFPRTIKEAAISDQPAIAMPRGKGQHILVVDDESQQQDIACQMLSLLGYMPHAVSSGEKALMFLQNHTADLILLDMIMAPGISGRMTYELILNNHPGQKALIITGYAEDSEVVATLQLGAGGLISKPYSIEQLAQAVYAELKKDTASTTTN